jgi:hypothetical protein
MKYFVIQYFIRSREMPNQQKTNSSKGQENVADRKRKAAVGITNRSEEVQRQEKVVKNRAEGQTGFDKIKRRRAA